jgi:hypothetical protein
MAVAAGREASAEGVAEAGVEELERAADSATARFGGAGTTLGCYRGNVGCFPFMQ